MAQAMRFGNDTEALLKAIDIGFEQSPKPREEVYKSCMKTLEMVSQCVCVCVCVCGSCAQPAC